MKILAGLAVAVLCCGVMVQGARAESSAAEKVVSGFYSQLVETMKAGEALGFQGRVKKLAPAIEAAYNMPAMARFAVGPLAWNRATPEQQQKFVKAFEAFSVATYASRFTKFDDEKFDVTGEKPASGGGVMVETNLTPKDSTPVPLNYLMKPDEQGKLRIVDVLMDASISELATRRSEFTAIVKDGGMDALITSLEEKTKKMGG